MKSSIRQLDLRMGITLAEVAISTVLTALLMVAALQAVRMSSQMNSEGSSRNIARQIAQDLLTEAMTQAYEEPSETPAFGRETNEGSSNRSNWDDVDDYHGYLATAIRDRQNNAISAYANYSASVQVTWESASSLGTTSPTETDLKKIVVTVSDQRGGSYQLVGYRTRGGQADQTDLLSGTSTSGVKFEWANQAGATGVGAVSLPNRVLP